MNRQKSRDAILISIFTTAVLLIVFTPFLWASLEHYIARMPLPPYPRASNIVIRYENNERITTFQTPDVSGDVLRFYELQLQKKGWKGGPSEESATTIDYTHVIEDTTGYSEIFNTTVVVSSSNGLTAVEIRESYVHAIIDRFGPGLNP
jgi:hypothetical protein